MLKIIIDATPIHPKPSGIGFYVANLISALNQLQTDENFQLGIVYQPGLTKWLRGDLSFPDSLKHYTHRAGILWLTPRYANGKLSTSLAR